MNEIELFYWAGALVLNLVLAICTLIAIGAIIHLATELWTDIKVTRSFFWKFTCALDDSGHYREMLNHPENFKIEIKKVEPNQ